MARRRRTAAVYRRRRLFVFGGLVLLIAALAVGVWLVIAQPWADAATEPKPTPTSVEETPEPVESESPSPQPTDDEQSAQEQPTAAPCQATDVTVEALTDASSYAAGESPELSISLTNTGSTDCTLDVGSATQTFSVSSGSDVWWRSTDCQENPSSMVVTLAAGQTVPSAAPVVWDRTRSSVDTCDQENRPRAPGGGASYHVAVSIGGFNSTITRQILLY